MHDFYCILWTRRVAWAATSHMWLHELKLIKIKLKFKNPGLHLNQPHFKFLSHGASGYYIWQDNIAHFCHYKKFCWAGTAPECSLIRVSLIFEKDHELYLWSEKRNNKVKVRWLDCRKTQEIIWGMAKQNQDELVFEGSSDFNERDSIQSIIVLFST